MRRILFIVLSVALVFKVEAQKSYDFEVDGLGYTLISPNSQNAFWTVEVSEITEELVNVVVPEQVSYNGQTMNVVKIELWHGAYSENKQNVKSITIPSNVNNVRLSGFPNLTSIAPIDGLQELVLYELSSLSQLIIPSSISKIGISRCYSLHKLIVLDGENELKWVNGYGITEGTFYAPIDTLYCGRNMNMSQTGYSNNFCLNLKSFGIGDNVTDLSLPHISDSLERLFVPKNLRDVHTSFHNGNWQEVVIEDAYGDLINSENHNSSEFYRSVFGAHTDGGYGLSCKKLYIGRNVPIFGFVIGCEQLICGPLTEYISLWGYTSGFSNEGGLEITGDSAYIKIYSRTPPEITTASYYPGNYFKNDTYMNTPLYVPRGSLEAYRNSDEWGLFFNIVEFDWDEPYYQIYANGNFEQVKITGERIYREGDTATLRARWQGNGSSDYVFYCWKENGDIVSQDNPYSFVVDGERTLEACYVKKKRNVCIKFVPRQEVNPDAENNMISCNGGYGWVEVLPRYDSIWIGSYSSGSTLFLKAIPKNGDSFLAWKDKFGNVLSEETEYSFIIEVSEEPAVTLMAMFGGTGIEEGLASKLYAIVNDRIVSIIGAEEQSEVLIYNSLGQEIYKGFERSIPIQKAGVYIVAIANKRIKIVVE